METYIYQSKNLPTWCPGCGNFGILSALKNAFSLLKIDPSKAIVVYDIGCNSNMYMSFKVHGFESLHGRPIPLAEGIRLVASDTLVLVVAGDGGTFGEGLNHFIHAARRNINLKVLVHDNKVYALTTGQASPTTSKGAKTKTTPIGNIENNLNPIFLALASGASFVARGFAGDLPYLTDLIIKTINHKGFAFLDILQPCVTFDSVNTYQFYKANTYKLEETQYKPDNLNFALQKSLEGYLNSQKLPLGIFFQEKRPLFEEELSQLKKSPLRDQPFKKVDLTLLFEEFK